MLQHFQSKIRGDLLGADKFIQRVLQRYPKSSVTIQLIAHDGQSPALIHAADGKLSIMHTLGHAQTTNPNLC